MHSATKDLDAQNSPAALLGRMRRFGRIQKRIELPTHRSVITKTLGVLGNDLSAVAVLDLGNREIVILVSDSFAVKPSHLTLRDKATQYGFKVVEDRLADTALIAEINSAISAGAQVTADSSDVKPIVEELLSIAIKKDTTDLHICCRENSGMTLFRVHSRLYRHRNFDVETCKQIASYMFTHMAEARTRSIGTFSLEQKSMSCTIRHSAHGRQFKLRYKFIRVADGWDVIVRILPMEVGTDTKTFTDLGYEQSQVDSLELAVSRSIGLVIITGPTGSGKSTTLKTMMEFDPKRKFKKRYSVEDPVEYKIFGVSQISVQRSDHEGDDENKEFQGILRDILRGDPDDIMVGETRDPVVAKMVADFVLTGHKMYTTSHTASAMTTPMRLFRLGIDRSILGDRQFFSVLMFQRLLPVLCDKCKLPAANVLPQKKQNLLKAKFGLNIDHICCSNEDGCDHCHNLGIIKSTIVAEIVVPDRVIRQHIADGHDDKAELYWRQSRKAAFDEPDMQGKTAFEHGLYKVSQGLIDPRDLELEFEQLETYEVVNAEPQE
ncbi:GspE/PulE family protein [Comamonas kerstersii]|uniref:Bacterial type II secretion system protein E domain-containing protein n=1 Tax=Comamonas kerstersii TaxID=225992 RepID=A0A6A1R0L9_9BURK|nr:ATPase, T2SS/T4P/T4SS family [Comamonas kerstersii]KAB0585775.1 hypothetical protein F7P80_12685 [Comamonas kerstersii]